MHSKNIKAIAIGASTGGPQALLSLFSDLGPDLRMPFFITQHMPAGFTALLADTLSKKCGLRCAEAVEGESVTQDRIYIAPGGYHLLVMSNRIHLSRRAQENFCRPAVDPMLRSLSAVYNDRLLAVILTGMGTDGLDGCRAVKAAGGIVLAQDEGSSVVWGMPRAVSEAGLCHEILPLEKMADAIRKYAGDPA